MTDIFEPGSLDGLNQNQLQQKSNEIKTSFDQKRNFYHQARNRHTEDFETWTELQKKVNEFDQHHYTP